VTIAVSLRAFKTLSENLEQCSGLKLPITKGYKPSQLALAGAGSGEDIVPIQVRSDGSTYKKMPQRQTLF